jgi:hypothetical protein
MPGDIFYSQVDSNLQLELNARGQSGRYGRDTRDMQFMLEKIANVQVTPYKKDGDNRIEITEAILGGTTVRSGEYLPAGPNGYLTDRKYTVTEQGIQGGEVKKKTAEDRVNTSRRIAPFITSCDVSVGDNSNGLLNTATINITIPNPERDLEYIESVYFRPGRDVRVQIAHPDSAIRSSTNLLTDETMPTAEKLLELYPNLTSTDKREFQKMNSVVFEGLVTSFTMDYQPDMSVNATVQLTGNSQVYTDISLIIDSTEQRTTKNEDLYENSAAAAVINKPASPELILPAGINIGGGSQLVWNTSVPPPSIPSTPIPANANITIAKALGSFYSNLNKEVQFEIDRINSTRGSDKKEGQAFGYVDVNTTDFVRQGLTWLIWGDPVEKGKTSYERYITLGYLIGYINSVILKKIKGNIPSAQIVCTDIKDVCTSNYYENLVSADPFRIFMAGGKHDTYGNLIWYNNDSVRKNIPFSEAIKPENASQKSKDRGDVIQTVNQIVSYPTRIFINMEVIQEIVSSLEKDETFTVSNLLNQISREIAVATGGAIDMQLIAHPEHPEYLLFYDASSTMNRPQSDDKKVKPYSIPMFSNHPNGTVIRDFKFSGKLPSDAANLAYVVGQDASQIAESDIAPYVAYMYAASTVERSGPHETVGNLITPKELADIKTKYKTTYETFLKQLDETKKAFGESPTNMERRAALSQALQKHIQYPTPTIIETNQLTAPVIPFDVEFTIDGINGFRYGDVLTFDALPTRYKRNAVFSIVSISHTVGTDGQWTSTIRCIMRPNIDVQ